MLDQATLDDVIERIVEVAEPEKIILFGSAARGDADPNSDIDLLVIKEGADALGLMARIYRRLRGVGAAVDAIVVSPDDVERYKDSHALIIKPAVRDGVVVYEAPERFPPDDPRECEWLTDQGAPGRDSQAIPFLSLSRRCRSLPGPPAAS